MIYTVTLNPALDRTITVKKLFEDDTTRVLSEKLYAGGKGIDVSRVIRELGGQSVALGLVGGYDGLHLEGLLINAGVMTDFTRISAETRTNIILKEEETKKQFVISASGPPISPTEIGELYHNVLQLQSVNYLVLSGSLPKGVTPNVYGQLILAGIKKEAFIVLDTDGKALKESINYGPTLIKPNRHELSRLTGKDLSSEKDILTACEKVHGLGIEYILVSRGKEGLILSTREKKIKAFAPPVEVDSTVGAGDSVVAGFVKAHSRGEELTGCLRLGCAAGTATAKTPGTELCHAQEVEKVLKMIEITHL